MKIVIEGHKFDTSKAEKNYQLECMTDDIMSQAELQCNPLKTEGCGDAQATALVLMQSLGRSALFPQLLAEAKKWKAKAIEERAQYLLFLDCNPDCTAWNFDELLEEDQNTLRRQAWISLKMEEPWVYVQLREAREQIKRLEAAFLKAEKTNLMHHMDADYADENAREAL